MQRKSSVIVMAFVTLTLVGCPPRSVRDPVVKPDTIRAGGGTKAAATSTKAAATSNCLADPTWFASPSFPTEVTDETSACSFEQFMWQTMIALVQPTAPGSDTLVFETWMPHYGIFVESGEPIAWGEEPPNGCGPVDPPPPAGEKTPRLYTDIIKQAGADQPLIDLQGQFVYYSMSVDQNAYNMLVNCNLYKAHCAGPLKPGNEGIDLINNYPNLAFPNGAIELKTSWMVLDQAAVDSGLFFSVPGWIQHKDAPCQLVTLGLTGIHIVSKTPKTPALIWATFEHRNNAPDCAALNAPPPLGGAWNFYNPDCTNCKTNTYQAGTPAQVCRMHPYGDSHIGTFPDGVDCSVDPNQFACQPSTVAILEESTAAIRSLNANVLSMIDVTATSDLIDRVWANYELVGNVWTVGGTLPPYLQAQRGSLSAANTSMETFVQNGVANVSNPYNCFSCHNMEGPKVGQTLPPVGLSHLFDEIKMEGGCADGTLPATCAPYTNTP